MESEKKIHMIKAYHSVGSDEWTPEERRSALHEILRAGRIVPAMERMDRGEMEQECFTGPERGSTLKQRFTRGNKKARLALDQLAREKLDRLPESGLTHGHFNCLDLVAGDLELVFLSPKTWYSSDNGFVFDAQELIKKGAGFRKTDLLGGFHAAVDGVLRSNHDSVGAAKEDLEIELTAILDCFQSRGREALRSLKDAELGSEIVWRGPLPLGMAVEVWEEGKNITGEVKRG
jgi:hypothetical protein